MTDTPAEVAEALACPFCGFVPTIVNVRADENQGTKWGGVVCSCGVVGPEVRTGYEPVAKWADKAIREWNDQHAARIIADLQSQLAAQRERDGRDAVWRDAVMDGHAVFCALTDYARRRTGAENVSDVLDAVAVVARAAMKDRPCPP
jgi:hypothetical protein